MNVSTMITVFKDVVAQAQDAVATNADTVAAVGEITIGKGLIAIGAALALLAGVGVAFAQGMIGASAVEAVARNPEADAKIRKVMIIGVALAETAVLYSFLIAILLVFVF